MHFCMTSLMNFCNKLLAHKDIRRSKYDEFRTELNAAADILEKLSVSNLTNIEEIAEHKLVSLITPVLTICKYNNPELLLTSLDLVQNLISNEFLKKIATIKRGDSDITISQEIIKILSDLQTLAKNNERLELCMIKIICPMICDSSNQIHGSDIITLLDIGIKILCNSRSYSNKNTSFAALNQMVSIIFQRLENNTLKSSSADLNEPRKISELDNQEANTEIRENPRLVSVSEMEVLNNDGNVSIGEVGRLASVDTDSEIKLKSQNVEKTIQHARSSSTVIKTVDILKDYNIDSNNLPLVDSATVYQFLCSLSIMKIEEPTEQSNIINVLTKRFSLELILTALQNSGNVFRNNECFMEMTRKYLFISITQNSISTNKGLFKVCVNIFLLLLENFRSTFKVQISVFFDVLFHILEVNTHLTDQVKCVLGEMVNVFQNIKSTTVIFTNYDCDLGCTNIFERLINAICSIAKNPSKISSSPNQESTTNNSLGKSKAETELRTIALRCLTSLLNSLQQEANNSNTNSVKPIPADSIKIPEVVEGTKSNDSLEAVKERKELLQEGILLFNLKPSKGIKFLEQHELIQKEPSSVAKFLKEEIRLDLTKIGEFLGEYNEYNLEIMHCYVDQVNVVGMDFLDALRSFLADFRLPGESQKIDRLMERFAGHYFSSNPDNKLFKSADDAYILAYSIIMLTTDLHSPMVKNKMEAQVYIEMNKNSTGTTNVPEEYLITIYNSIRLKGIELKTNYSTSKTTITADSSKETGDTENINIANSALQRMEEISTKMSSFVEIEAKDMGKNIFQTIWKYLVVCFGWVFQETEDQNIYVDCLKGIRNCIKLSCHYKLDLSRDTFIKSLISFSMLGDNSTISDMRTKNINAISTLLLVAKEDGNYLGSSWTDILQCISHLDQFQILGFSLSDTNKIVISEKKSQNHPSSHEGNKNTYLANFLSENVSQSISVAVDHIFTSSAQLNSESIIIFIKYICDISLKELSQLNYSSFMLQKIVEVAYYNMARTRFDWNHIWSILGPYFIKAASVENENIAKTCIDSLKQLSNKFLEREEYGNYHFQAEFLKPFEYIMIHAKYFDVKELGIRCIHQMVQSQAKNIKSGWTTVFNVLYHTSLQNSEQLEDLAFLSIHSIIDQKFDVIIDWFDKVLSCIKAFACNSKSENFNVRAIHQLGICFDRFYSHIVNSIDTSSQTKEELYDNLWNQGWKPIIITLVEIIQTTSSYVRAEALLLLFNLLKINQSVFNQKWWQELFAILNSIFHVLSKNETDLPRKKKIVWLSETCSGALMGTLELYIVNYEKLPPEVSTDMFNHLKWCIDQNYEILGATALFSFRRMVKLLSARFNASSWEEVMSFLKYILTYTIPEFLYTIPTRNCKALNLVKLTDSNDSLSNTYTYSLWDYSTYSAESLKKIAPLLLVERENSLNECLLQIHLAFSKCRLDLEFQEGLKTLLENTEEKFEDGSDTVVKTSILSNLPINLMWELNRILNEHQLKLKEFNMNSELVSTVANHIEETSPAIKQLWKGKIQPRFISQECLSLICILANIRLISLSCDYSDDCVNHIIILCKEIFTRCGELLAGSADSTMCNQLLTDTLKFLKILPETKFKICITKLYPHLWPLIPIIHNESTVDLLSGIFARLEKYICVL